VIEAIECLKGHGPADLMEVTLALTAKMVVLGKLERTEKAARARLQRTLDSGAALEKFREIIAAQGGDARVIDDYSKLPRAARIVDIRAAAAGWVFDVDAMAIAQAAMRLGAGRERIEDAVDHAVGVSDIVPTGTRVTKGDILCRLHLNREQHAGVAHELAQTAFVIRRGKPRLAPLVREEVL